MQLADTIVLVGSLNTASAYHSRASKYLNLIATDQETFVPAVNLIELDLVMKGRNYTFDQRRDAFDLLSDFIPESKIVPNSTTSLKIAAGLEKDGMSYFDSLISAIAVEKEATVLTTDDMISKVARVKW